MGKFRLLSERFQFKRKEDPETEQMTREMKLKESISSSLQRKNPKKSKKWIRTEAEKKYQKLVKEGIQNQLKQLTAEP